MSWSFKGGDNLGGWAQRRRRHILMKDTSKLFRVRISGREALVSYTLFSCIMLNFFQK